MNNAIQETKDLLEKLDPTTELFDNYRNLYNHFPTPEYYFPIEDKRIKDSCDRLEHIRRNILGDIKEGIYDVIPDYVVHEILSIIKIINEHMYNLNKEMNSEEFDIKDKYNTIVTYVGKILDSIHKLYNSSIALQTYRNLHISDFNKKGDRFSKDYKEQFDAIHNSWTYGLWLASALIFMMAALLCIYYFLFNTADNDITSTLSRISAVFILMSGAFFCASQYNKQKDLAEDYRHKVVITRSMSVFLDDIRRHSSKEETNKYMHETIKEIQRHPTEKQNEGYNIDINGVIDIVKRLIDKVHNKS